MNKTITFFCCLSFIILAGLMTSCTKMDHYYKDYIIERTYVGSPDSMWVRAGDNRMQLNWLTPTDPGAQNLVVIWNNRKDSAVTTINNNADKGNFIIENLPEGPFTFWVVTTDNAGNRSVPREMTTEIYGDIFKNRLSNRAVDYWIPYSDSIVVLLKPSGDKNLLYTLIEYTDKSGHMQTAKVGHDDIAVTLRDFDVNTNTTISLKSGFYPGDNVLDTFYSPLHVFNINDFKAPNSLTLNIPSDATIDFIDFNLVKSYTSLPGEVILIPKELHKTFDLGHLRGGGSKHNFLTINSTRASAFSAILYSGITAMEKRNAGLLVNLGISANAATIYDNLDESNRSSMIAAFESAKASFPTAEAFWPINTGQVLFLHSIDRDIYVAIKATNSNPDGPITIEFKISRP